MASLSSTMFSTAMLPRKPAAVSATSLHSLSNFKQAALFGLNSSLRRVVSFECPDDVYVLDQADEAGYELPYSCHTKSCSSCAGNVVGGSVDLADGSFLVDDQIEEGWVLTCVAYPTFDVTIETHKEEELTG
ncbi:hypothetical protein DH2020_038361 [Rehmannia glutinosa]|uniref:Ferredoxin n=1 Tax=Rehmannia glutinosa TaxID=99300 RepID=A0ABR0UYR1_REHGL